MWHATPPRSAAVRAPVPVAGPCWPVPLQETLRHSKAGLAQSPVGVFAPFPWFWCARGFICALWASLAGMRFDIKHDCAPPTVLLGLLLCLKRSKSGWPNFWKSLPLPENSLKNGSHSLIYKITQAIKITFPIFRATITFQDDTKPLGCSWFLKQTSFCLWNVYLSKPAFSFPWPILELFPARS